MTVSDAVCVPKPRTVLHWISPSAVPSDMELGMTTPNTGNCGGSLNVRDTW